MARQTTAQDAQTLANQMFAAAQAAEGGEREALLAMAERYEAKAAELRVAEAAKDRADREFWARQDVLTNWVG